MECGPDNVPVYLLSNLVYSITRPLFILFNRSLAEGELPDLWKESFIVPIFKSGERENVQNYRGISKQSAIPKLLDGLVYDQLSWICKGIVVEEQHGFMGGRSTVTNLITYENALVDALERGCQVDSIYTDFSKAFDRVSHQKLLAKLRAMGFHERSVKWLESMLVGRSQRVKMGGFISNSIEVTSGVPQGGHCAPLLFNIFINDIRQAVPDCSFLLFADDLKLYREIVTEADCMKLQESLNLFVHWCNHNGLSLNPEKRSMISFCRKKNKITFQYKVGDEDLLPVSSLKDLGVIMDAQLSFREHYSCMTRKAFQMLGLLFRIGRDLSIDSMKKLYCSLVRSHLEYASTVWSPYYNVHSAGIERVQNKFIGYCSHRLGLVGDRGALASMLGLRTLEDRRRVSDLSTIFKLLNGVIDCPPLLGQIQLKVPERCLRRNEIFVIGHHGTNYGVHSPLTRFLLFLNNNPSINPFGGSLSGFKGQVIKVVCDH